MGRQGSMIVKGLPAQTVDKKDDYVPDVSDAQEVAKTRDPHRGRSRRADVGEGERA